MNAALAGWLRLPISEVASFGSGELISVVKLSNRSGMSPVPVFGGNGIAGYTSSATVLEPTVILGRVGQKCGVVYRNDGPAWITDNALYARRFKRPVDVRFFALALEAARLNDLKNKNDLPLITQSILNDVKIAWPDSLAEQRRIADTVSAADDLIATLQRTITKKEAIRQGLMQQLLTGRSRIDGFTGSWEEVTLGSAGEVSGGGVDKKSVSGEAPVRLLNYMDVYRSAFVDAATPVQVTPAPRAKIAKCAIRSGDVFFTPTSETPDDIARSAVAKENLPDAVYSYHLVRWRPAGEWDIAYLGFAFATAEFRAQASTLAAGSGTRYVISLPGFRSLRFRRPPVPEQRAIGSLLKSATEELSVLEKRLNKARAIKTGMMQELLTGRTRLRLESVS